MTERPLRSECDSERQSIRTRRAMTSFWWRHERDEQLRGADVLAARRAENAAHDAEPARPLPAAG